MKVCGGKFLEDVSGLCSQGTSCSQCEHGTLSMRSISMTIIFILQQSGSRQHSTTGGKTVLLPIRYTLGNILAVSTNKAMRENIVTRYQPSSRCRSAECPVELSRARAATLLPTPIGLGSPLLSVAVNATSDGFLKSSVLDR